MKSGPDEPLAFTLGHAGKLLRITVTSRAHPSCSDFYDGNWLNCLAEAEVGCFRASIKCYLRSDELEGFLRDLAAAYRNLDGDAELEPMEHWLSLKVSVDSRGHVLCKGQLRDELAGGNTLKFQFKLDQTFLPPVINDLSLMLEHFPVIGRP